MWKNIDAVEFPIMTPDVPGRIELVKAAVKKHGAGVAKVQARAARANGYAYRLGHISVRGASYVQSRAIMHAILDSLAAQGVSRSTLSSQF